MTFHAARWRMISGWMIALLLPFGVLWKIQGDTADLSPLVRYVALFILAVIAAKIGKWISGSLWDQDLRSLLDDGVLAALLGLVAYTVATWMGHHGGGPVNPTWAALAGAYLTIIWPIRP